MNTLPPPVTLQERGRPGLATSALVLGIIATVLIAVPMLSAPCGIIAIVHGAKAKSVRDHRGLAVAGFVLGIIAVSLTSLVFLARMANGSY
jgi:hypothetical protein